MSNGGADIIDDSQKVHFKPVHDTNFKPIIDPNWSKYALKVDDDDEDNPGKYALEACVFCYFDFIRNRDLFSYNKTLAQFI